MTVALHNCSNKDDSGVGSRGSAKWNKQMATERKKSKENTHLGFQFKAPIRFLFFVVVFFAHKMNFLKLLTFVAVSFTICFQVYNFSLSATQFPNTQ